MSPELSIFYFTSGSGGKPPDRGIDLNTPFGVNTPIGVFEFAQNWPQIYPKSLIFVKPNENMFILTI